MNINDVKEEIEIPTDIWKSIFEKQMELAKKYSEIEGMGDLLDTLENNINTAKGQKWIKDFAWRFTEEIAEAYETRELPDREGIEAQLDEHFKEELIDALHFLVELTIIADYDYNLVKKIHIDDDYMSVHPFRSIFALGLMCNTLKNKPWKQTQMLTDKTKFEALLTLTWKNFKTLLLFELGSLEEIFKYYFKKQSVNKFRQRSKY